MSKPRPATTDDAAMLARLHVDSWRETYPGLLPATEIAARGFDVRLPQWQAMLARGTSRIAVVDRLGFAQMGPQRETGFLSAGYTDEIYSLYLLRAGQGRGLGRALVSAVKSGAPFTAAVLADNKPACRFYHAIGGIPLERRLDAIGNTEIDEIVYGFDGN